MAYMKGGPARISKPKPRMIQGKTRMIQGKTGGVSASRKLSDKPKAGATSKKGAPAKKTRRGYY